MNKILIFSGAGLSAESGLSTFRDADGLWHGADPMEVANIHSFRRNKDLVRNFYNSLRTGLKDVQPNAAHEGIAKLQKDYGSDVVQIFTQNVDDLLERAGCEHVHHVHGFLPWMMCIDPGHCNYTWDIGYTNSAKDAECPKCGSKHIKPAVVFFGENAPGYQKLYSTFGNSRRDLIIVIGTSGEVVPLERVAGNRHSTRKSQTLLNNKDYDPLGYVNLKLFDIVLLKPASEAWPRIREIADAFIAKPYLEDE